MKQKLDTISVYSYKRTHNTRARISIFKMNRATKKKALADLRARRNGLSAVSRTDEYEVKEDDVYERLDEQEYEQLVEKRREREDFVVDDGTSK